MREDQVAIFADEYVSLFAGRSTLEYQDHYIRKTTPKFGRESRLKKKVVQVYFSFEKRFIFFSIFFLFSVSGSDYLTGQTSQSIIMKHYNNEYQLNLTLCKTLPLNLLSNRIIIDKIIFYIFSELN